MPHGGMCAPGARVLYSAHMLASVSHANADAQPRRAVGGTAASDCHARRTEPLARASCTGCAPALGSCAHGPGASQCSGCSCQTARRAVATSHPRGATQLLPNSGRPRTVAAAFAARLSAYRVAASVNIAAPTSTAATARSVRPLTGSSTSCTRCCAASARSSMPGRDASVWRSSLPR